MNKNVSFSLFLSIVMLLTKSASRVLAAGIVLYCVRRVTLQLGTLPWSDQLIMLCLRFAQKIAFSCMLIYLMTPTTSWIYFDYIFLVIASIVNHSHNCNCLRCRFIISIYKLPHIWGGPSNAFTIGHYTSLQLGTIHLSVLFV